MNSWSKVLPNYVGAIVLLLFFFFPSPVQAELSREQEMLFNDEIMEQLNLLRQDRILSQQVQSIPAHQQEAVYEAVALSTTTPPDLTSPPSPDSSIQIGPRPPSAFNDACSGRTFYGQLTRQQGNSFCYGPAPIGYKATIDPYMCLNMDQFFETCPPYGNGFTQYGRCGMTSGATWGPPGKPSTTAWGTWTSWWKGLSDYCMKEGYWSDSNASRLPDVNTSATIRFTIAGTAGDKTYDSAILKSDPTMLSVEGLESTTRGRGARTLTSPTFNSPFIYLRNQVGEVAIKLRSVWNQYQSQQPAFNQAAGWVVSEAREEPLFYELGLKEVTLSRQGRVFMSKDELVDYLVYGDFFDRLGFSATEKENSLGYLLPKLSTAPYYYLSILSDEAVSAISIPEIEPQPDTFVRRYFAVYPTQSPVLVSGDLNFPSVVSDEGFTVRDYGEIIVTPDMFVLWQ